MRRTCLLWLASAACLYEQHPQFGETSAGTESTTTITTTATTTDTTTTGGSSGTIGGSASTTIDPSTTSTTADSSTTVDPPATEGGEHFVFISSTFQNGGFGGAAGADTICQGLATAAALPGTFRAIVSEDGSAARDRIAITGPVRTMDGEVVADDEGDLWDGMLPATITTTELGGQDANGAVWTGTTADGQPTADNCANWTSTDTQAFGGRGLKAEADARWIAAGTDRCGKVFHLYCISQ